MQQDCLTSGSMVMWAGKLLELVLAVLCTVTDFLFAIVTIIQ